MKTRRISQLKNLIKELERCCECDVGKAKCVGDANVKKALKCLKRILADDEKLLSYESLVDVKDLIYCCLILIKYSTLQFKLDFKKKLSKQPIIKIQSFFCLIITMSLKERTINEIIGIVMEIMRTEKLWNIEVVSIEILKSLLIACDCAEIIVNTIFNLIGEREMVNEDVQRCVRIFYSVINFHFQKLPTYVVIRLITFYYLSIETRRSEKNLSCLRNGLKVTLIKLFGVIETIQENIEFLEEAINRTFSIQNKMYQQEFASTMLRGISIVSRNELSKNFKSEIVDQLLYKISSKCEAESKIACNFLTTLVDRHQNSKHFQVPIVFFLNTNYGFNKLAPTSEDENALKAYSYKIEKTILSVIKTHGNKYENLISIYKLICVIIANYPTLSINILFMKILLKLQNFAIEIDRQHTGDGNSIHAIIISIMTLICYISRAKSLSAYIHNIVCFRYDIAPFLNPPIKKKRAINVSMKDIQPSLLIDKWELRFCLWMHYRLGEKTASFIYDTTLDKIKMKNKI